MAVFSLVTDWLNENEHRSYPLLEYGNFQSNTEYVLPLGLIVDLLLMFTGSPLTDTIELLSIENNAGSITFTFTGSGNAFMVANTITEYTYIRNSNGSLLVVSPTLIGDIPSGTHLFSNVYVEPATCYEMSGAWLGVTSITGAPLYQSQSGTDDVALPIAADTSTPPLTGDVLLTGGFNFDVSFNGQIIQLHAGFGYGQSVSCVDQFINPDDLDCSEIISYINGMGPNLDGTFNLVPGTNIDIFQITNSATQPFYDPYDGSVVANPHTLFVGFDFDQTDICSPINIFPPEN